MTTETINLPPCPLPDCGVGEHHYHDIDAYAIGEKHDCGSVARIGYRCYGPHRPGLSEPISLPEITDEMVEFARNRSMIDTFGELHSFAVAIRLALLAAIPLWQPIEPDQIKAGMRIRTTVVWSDGATNRTGVAHHTNRDGNWYTGAGLMLTGWLDPTTYEVDPATIPADPDADLIEKLVGLGLTSPEDAREAIAAIRSQDKGAQE